MRTRRSSSLLAVLVGLIGLALVTTSPAAAQRQDPRVPVHIFYSTTCPHCTKARTFLANLAARISSIVVQGYELSADRRIESLFVELSEVHAINPPAVPLILVGDAVFVGYGEDLTSGAEIEAAVRACLVKACPDPVAPRLARHGLAGGMAGPVAQPPDNVRRPPLPETVRIPLFGEIALKNLSLPALTVVLGAIDGFNPCAMWVLVLLIGLLMGMKDTVRMWVYGGVFLLTSAAVYFLFLSAWLNAFLFLGALPAIRIVVGVFALGAGAWYIAEFWRNPDAACKVTTPGSRQRITDRMRAAVAEPSFLAAILAIMALAIAVNMIELLCSAGIPAVYTHLLAMSGLSSAAHYGYLLLYTLIFLLDDVLVFAVAMITLRQAGLIGTYARYSHLVGGVVLFAVGALLLLRPELLAFA